MTYDSVESSVAGAQRVDLYVFAMPGETVRLCTGSGDRTFDGDVYSVASISSSAIPLVPLGGRVREVTISLALDHALSIELRRSGVPPQNTLVTIRRMHIGDSGSKVWWRGYVGTVATDGVITRIRVPNKTDLAFVGSLPAKLADRRCPHILGDVGCGVDLIGAGFQLTPTVAGVSIGRTLIEVSSISGKPDGWASNGKLVRVSDGEKRTILAHIGVIVSIDYPFRTIEVGDALELYAGCDHSLKQDNGCRVKFDNAERFGGDPELPTDNPSSPLGVGVKR